MTKQQIATNTPNTTPEPTSATVMQRIRRFLGLDS